MRKRPKTMDDKEKAKSIGTCIKRLPGQALREEESRLLDQISDGPLLLMAFGWCIFGIECLHIFTRMPPSLWLGLLFAIPMTAYALVKIGKLRTKLRTLRQGEEGERIVAQAIEQDLIPQGYVVFHDVPLEKDGRNFNVDHLLVGLNGIFAIETKNYTKPAKGRPEVRYDGKTILWCGKCHTECDEIAQSMSTAQSAKRLIDELTGLSVFVQPVLCAVGWYVNSTNLYGNPILLVMEKTLKSTIPKVTAKWQPTEVERNKIVAALKRNIGG